jgi:hypothetical protein
MVLGFVLYLNATNDSERIQTKPSSKGDPKTWPKRWVVGRQVKISKEILAAGRSESSGTSWKLEGRHVVRGHFRQQACGPNHSERKTIWIAPFMKGPEGAEAWSHVYEVK